jgi:hypothetical protein
MATQEFLFEMLMELDQTLNPSIWNKCEKIKCLKHNPSHKDVWQEMYI